MLPPPLTRVPVRGASAEHPPSCMQPCMHNAGKVGDGAGHSFCPPGDKHVETQRAECAQVTSAFMQKIKPVVDAYDRAGFRPGVSSNDPQAGSLLGRISSPGLTSHQISPQQKIRKANAVRHPAAPSKCCATMPTSEWINSRVAAAPHHQRIRFPGRRGKQIRGRGRENQGRGEHP